MAKQLDPVGTSVAEVVNVLAGLFQQKLAYCTINSFRSAISAGHSLVGGAPVGEHPWVCKLLKGIRLSRPPEPRYAGLWDVNIVLRFLSSWQDNSYLSRKEISAKLAMLLCLISCKRVSDVRALDISARVFTPEGVTFTVSRRTKSSIGSVTYPAFPDSPKLCG